MCSCVLWFSRGIGRQGKVERYCCNIIRGAPTTAKVTCKGLRWNKLYVVWTQWIRHKLFFSCDGYKQSLTTATSKFVYSIVRFGWCFWCVKLADGVMKCTCISVILHSSVTAILINTGKFICLFYDLEFILLNFRVEIDFNRIGTADVYEIIMLTFLCRR